MACPVLLRTTHRVVLSAVVFLLLLPLSALGQADWSSKVIKQKDIGKKEEIVCLSGFREGVTAEVLAKLTARERHGPAVAAAAGQYFEKGTLDQDTPPLLRALADRPDIGAQAIAYAALSPSARELIVGLSASKSEKDQRVAARMLAATAVMRNQDDRANKRLAENVAGTSSRLNINYREQVVALLSSKDELVLEYTLLAVAIDRIAYAKDAIAPHVKSKDQAVARGRVITRWRVLAGKSMRRPSCGRSRPSPSRIGGGVIGARVRRRS